MENSYLFDNEAQARAEADALVERFKENETHLVVVNPDRLKEFLALFKDFNEETTNAINDRFGGDEWVTIVSFRTAVATITGEDGVQQFFPVIHPNMAVRGSEAIMFNREFSLPLACLDFRLIADEEGSEGVANEVSL